ncbi:MAG: prolyl oligopeptidase family serine peptidase [Alphaproteobacteria bacterium]|nr:prolyl oligopeptidase family serine peptidase [Alphaproteobacteria bacterium]
MKPPSDDTIIHLHGVDIPDPFRPLEKLDSPETLAWIDYQQQRTNADIIDRKAVAAHVEEMKQIFDYPKQFLPLRRGNRKFFYANEGLQRHNVLMLQEGNDAPKPLIDPNSWPVEEARTLDVYAPSPDGKYVAYFTSHSGSDWKDLHLLDVDTGHLIDGPFPTCRLLRFPAWKTDSSGFIFPRPMADPADIKAGGNPDNKLFEHRVGTSPAQDTLYYEPPAWAHRSDKMHVYCGAMISLRTGAEFVFLSWGASAENAVYWRNPQGQCVELLAPDRGSLYPMADTDGYFYGQTTVDAPRGRLVRIDPAKPESENWHTIIAERPDAVLQDFALVGDHFVTVWRQDIAEHVEAFSKTGEPLGTVYAPELSSLSLQLEHPTDAYVQINEASYRLPYIFHRYDAQTQHLSFLDKAKIERDLTSDDIVIEQVEATSKDGTMVPMAIIYDRTKVKFDGTALTKMSGYGGFGIKNEIFFNTETMRRIEQGGIFVDTFVRGGGDRGRAWHLAGTKKNKQKSYDDFTACAEYLIKHRYTSAERLEIAGASNCGLMVLTCAIQRPDLFGAAFPDMPVADLIRFTTATAGPHWVNEYGDPENPDEFQHLCKIAPLHNIQKGQRYPAMVITAGRDDVRVVPWHAYKFVAAMQMLSPETPCYLNVLDNAGHFGAVGLDKRLEVAAIKEGFSRHILGPIPPEEYKIWKAAQKTGAGAKSPCATSASCNNAPQA